MKAKTEKSNRSVQNSRANNNHIGDTGFFAAQPKLKVGKPGDKYEQEADRVAEEVVNSTPETSTFFSPARSLGIQTKPIARSITPFVQKYAEEEEAQAKFEIQRQEEEEEEAQAKLEIQYQEEEEEEELQAKRQNESNPRQITENLLQNSRGGGSSMDQATRTQMESGFGADFSNVRIHTDNTAVQMNKEMGAHAFTSGNDIYFNNGKYSPDSQNGKVLLAHELTHTIQQGHSGQVQNKVQRWPWDLSVEDQKRLFRSRNYGPITYTQGGAGAGFDASYHPATNSLNIEVRGKVRFADSLTQSGTTFTSPNSFMRDAGLIPVLNRLPAEVQARIMPYFQWTEREKQVHLIRFMHNVSAITSLWQDTGMSFKVNEPGWEDITATPHINIDITEGDAVHQTETRSIFGISFQVTDTAGSDHVQIELVKQPSVADFREIKRIITEHNAAEGAGVTSGMVRGVRSYQGNDRGSRNSAPAGFNNFMSLESDRSDATGNQTYDSCVMFGNNESTLSEDARLGLEDFFSNPIILADNAGRAVEITLTGYASAPGSTLYNSSLVESRLDEVESYVLEIASRSNLNANISNNIWRSNDSDESAEADLASNPETHDPASFRRVDLQIVRTGRTGQNVLAHEFGHIFGLGDEYAEGSRHAGDAARHDPLARRAGVTGGAVVGNDDRIMSGRNRVGAAHYSTFADALNRLTSKQWIIIT